MKNSIAETTKNYSKLFKLQIFILLMFSVMLPLTKTNTIMKQFSILDFTRRKIILNSTYKNIQDINKQYTKLFFGYSILLTILICLFFFTF